MLAYAFALQWKLVINKAHIDMMLISKELAKCVGRPMLIPGWFVVFFRVCIIAN